MILASLAAAKRIGPKLLQLCAAIMMDLKSYRGYWGFKSSLFWSSSHTNEHYVCVDPTLEEACSVISRTGEGKH